jgi:peroxiredoxin
VDGATQAPPADRVSRPDEPKEPAPSDREAVGHRLDPDLAASLARSGQRSPDGAELPQTDPAQRATPDSAELSESRAARTPRPARPVLDNRRYGWGLGIFGLVVVVVVSVYLFLAHGVGTTGVPAGQRLRAFAAPLANSTLKGIANTQNPTCVLANHDPRALNTCLIVRRRPLVLSFFVTGSSSCVGQVDALQRLAGEFPTGSVQFAAVAVHASQSATAALVRSHHWTIPVAYDSGGEVQNAFGISICPIAELVDRGGIVANRLIGDRWRTGTELAPAVRALIARNRGGVGTEQ